MPTEITDGVYDITCEEDGEKRYRVYLFNDGTPTLIDAGMSDTVDAIVEGIAEIGVEPVRLIISHGDPDHIGGFDGLVERFDLETWVPEQSDLDTDHAPDHRYGDGDAIGQFTAVHVPGHKPDNHALVAEDSGIVVMGDAVSGADQRGLPAGNFALPPAVYSVDLNQAEENLERLLAFDFEIALVFHGSSVTEDAGEKLDRFVNFPGKP